MDNPETETEIFVWTPYYYGELSPEYLNRINIPAFNFTQYSLFVLKTNLLPWLREEFGTALNIRYEIRYQNVPSVNFDTKSQVGPLGPDSTSNLAVEKISNLQTGAHYVIIPLNGNTPYKNTDPEYLNKIQRKVYEICQTSNGALIDVNNIYMSLNRLSGITVINRDWIMKILPYIHVNKEIHSYINKYGLGIKLDKIKDYDIVYNEIFNNITSKLLEMYHKGYIVDPDNTTIKNWKLINESSDTRLYYPAWTDARISDNYEGIVNFLYTRMMGDTSMKYHIGLNDVTRHFVADALLKAGYDSFFVDEHVIFRSLNIDDTIKILSIIDIALVTGIGKVYVWSCASKKILETKLKYLSNHENSYFSSATMYYILRPSTPYVLSVLLTGNTVPDIGKLTQ